MSQSELILLNFKEVRRRSKTIWSQLTEQYYHWKPDEKAMTAIETVRHVLEADYGWNIIINNGDMKNYQTPWENRPFISITDEILFAEYYRKIFLDSISQYSDKELVETEIVHPGDGDNKILGKYLMRIVYYESVHAGQFLFYLRAMKIDRPNIWD